MSMCRPAKLAMYALCFAAGQHLWSIFIQVERFSAFFFITFHLFFLCQNFQPCIKCCPFPRLDALCLVACLLELFGQHGHVDVYTTTFGKLLGKEGGEEGSGS